MLSYALLASAVPLVAAHGFISSPEPRRPNEAFGAACGAQALSQQSSDINGNIQGIMQVLDANFDADACNLWLCKGFLMDEANVQSYTPGQTIDFEINIAAPHTGVANVSVVRTSTNSVIGSPLIEFENYASTATGVDPSNRAFSVTLPEDLEGDCTTAGDCVLQWWWDARDIDQTYAACVDFTVSGSGSGSPAPAPSASASATTSVAVPEPTTSVTVPEPTTSVSVPEPTTSPTEPIEDDEEEEDDECPADDDEEDEEEDEEDDECPADDEEEEDEEEEDDECPAEDDEEEEEEEDEDECPADDDEEEEDDEESTPEVPAPSDAPRPTFVSATLSQTAVAVRPTTFSTLIREVTVTASASTVTVTAPGSAECTTA